MKGAVALVLAVSVAATGSSASSIKDDQISSFVSPVTNRQIETVVKAHDWPSDLNNVLCEAYEYHQGGKDAQIFMERLVDVLKTGPFPNDIESAVEVSTKASPSEQTELLEYSLELRAYSPACEMYRGLAREEVIKNPSLLGKDAFLIQADKETLLPQEVVLGESGEGDSSIAILYADMSTESFVNFYDSLRESGRHFVVRHKGNVAYEDEPGRNCSVVVLQGYGVRVDIRNVEYRAFDDRRSSENGKSENDGSLLNVPDLASASNTSNLGGIEMSVFQHKLSLNDALNLQSKLWTEHDRQQIHSQILPPTWQRRQLPLQAAAVIVNASDSGDVLLTLEEVSQNLPSLASTLVHVDVPSEIHNVAEVLDEQFRHRGVTLTFNGRKVFVNRPSFNVFEMINLLREEQLALQEMKRELGEYMSLSSLFEVQKAWVTGQSWREESGFESSSEKVTRINLLDGEKPAILYINDIEKDQAYADWPRDLQQALMAMQFGAPPAVRRNLFTLLAVFDPLSMDDAGNSALQIGLQLLQGQYPARIGLLIFSEIDLDDCRRWVRSGKSGACPVLDIFKKGTVPSQRQLSSTEATTHAVYRLVAHVKDKFGGDGMLLAAYITHFLSYIQQAVGGGQAMKLDVLLSMHSQILAGFQIQTQAEALSEAKIALVSKKTSIDNYGDTLRFAVTKGLLPGMGFANGRPLPIGDVQKASDVFQQELGTVFQMIANGDITSDESVSVHDLLLSGDSVFGRVHPLISQTRSHIDLKYMHTQVSLITDKTGKTEEAEALLMLEVVLNLGTEEGILFAESVINAVLAFEGVSDKNDFALAYRFLSSSDEPHKLCGVLLNAGKGTLHELLKHIMNGEAMDEETSCYVSLADDRLPGDNFVALNGRVYAPDSLRLEQEDIELLVQMELGLAKATTSLLRNAGEVTFDAVVAAAKFLAAEESSPIGRDNIVSDIDYLMKENGVAQNPLALSWNENKDDLRVSVTAIVDPVSEAAQRAAPLLRVLRDKLGLPLLLVIAPKITMEADDKISSYYRFVAEPTIDSTPMAVFSNLPSNHILTIRLDVPEAWNIQQTQSIQDTDNLRCDVQSKCGDTSTANTMLVEPLDFRIGVTHVEYGLKNLLVFGQCYCVTDRSPPNGLQLNLYPKRRDSQSVQIEADGSMSVRAVRSSSTPYSDTLVMKNAGYWQLRANPGHWDVRIAESSRGAEIMDIINRTSARGNKTPVSRVPSKSVVVKDFVSRSIKLFTKRRPGYEKASLFYDERKGTEATEDEKIHVFSLATGHLYERLLKIMMLSVTKRSSTKVKFWLFENFLSPSFKQTAHFMAQEIGCEVEFVTYKWPEWLRSQQEKQRLIWGYKILFLDVLFPLDVKKIIYVDADQVVRADLKELWKIDLEGKPYAYTPMCSSREDTLGYAFWRQGFWKSHLRNLPYHISALYVVDLEKFRTTLVGDQLRSIYQQLSADPNSLANLDQDLPNYAQHQVPIFSLPQEWLWCESWCSDESKASAKTIDLCNNPLHKESKVHMAKRVISGDLFKESWVELDAEVQKYEDAYHSSNPES